MSTVVSRGYKINTITTATTAAAAAATTPPPPSLSSIVVRVMWRWQQQQQHNNSTRLICVLYICIWGVNRSIPLKTGFLCHEYAKRCFYLGGCGIHSTLPKILSYLNRLKKWHFLIEKYLKIDLKMIKANVAVHKNPVRTRSKFIKSWTP